MFYVVFLFFFSQSVLFTICCVQLLNHVWLSASLWTAAHQTSLSFTISQSLLKLMSIESVMPFNHFILSCPLLLLLLIFPSIRVFSSELAFCIRWPNIGASASASVLLMNIQGYFPLGLFPFIRRFREGNGNPLQYSCLENPMDRTGHVALVGYSPWGRKESDMTEWLVLTCLYRLLGRILAVSKKEWN